MNKILSTLMFVVFIFWGPAAFAHERAEVNGISIVFGGEPEPIITHERQYLVWRFSDGESNEDITDIEDAEAVVTFGGEEYDGFTARGSRRTPGVYRTSHIFTEPGEGEVTLSFKREGSDEVHTVTFSFTVHPRSDMEIPN